MKKQNQNIYRRRILMTAAAAGVLWLLLLGRLYYLQIVSHEELKAGAAAQYQVPVEGIDTRGAILDRNLQPLTGGTQQYYYFIPKELHNSQLNRILAAVSARRVSSAQSSSRYAVYRSQLFDETAAEKLRYDYGAYVFGTVSRYSDTQTACHLIGYLNESEKKGVSGLEKLYENQLKSDGSRLTLWADGSGRLLAGYGPFLEGGKKLQQETLVTSIDSGIQKVGEEAMMRKNLKGSVLVSDVQTGEILAWVSSPAFNPNTVEKYLNESGDNLMNKCIQGTYAPGSVFKIVTAAAALESGRFDPGHIYICQGETEVEGIRLGCQAGPEDGHGEVDMYRAMAVSCNCYFAELGAALGTDNLLDMAERLGFGKKVFDSFSEEAGGHIPSAEETGPWDISNLSIGQGSLLVTPAQVHQMMSVVAGGGVLQPLCVLRDAQDAEAGGAKHVLSEYTADQLSLMLRQVMTEGTGAGFSWNCTVYGKTGTAETGISGKNSCWFSGFCQVEGRMLTVTVLAENESSGASACLPVFQEISSYLAERNYTVKQ